MLELYTGRTGDHGTYQGPERRSQAAPMTRLLARMLDEIDHGMLLVTPGGTLRHANQPARLALLGAHGLCLTEGQVHATQREQHGLLMHALTDAGHGRRRLLTLGQGEQPLSVAVVPLSDDGEGSEALALLVLGKRQSCEALTVDFFARTQGLTGAEAKVLQALCDGLRPKEVASRFDVAVSTVRTQISSIRTKTQTASIRDLIHRVTTLPPITTAMKSMLSH